MCKELALLLSVAAAWMTPAQAQEASQGGTPTFQSGTRMVLVPVVVRDHEGHTVANLGRENFQVFDKGKEQPITAFSVEQAGGTAGATAAAPPPAQFIAYLFDDATLHDFGTVMPLREAALHEFSNLRPDDRVAIFSSSCRLTLDFTGDRAKLQETISKLDPNPVRICRVAPTLPLQITLLDAIVKRMTHLPGAKRIVVVSPGFNVNRDEQKMREALIDAAAQAKVTIDSLHIVESTGSQSGVPRNPKTDSDFNARMPGGGDNREINSENLNIVADGTGGTVIEAGNAPEAGLRTLATPDCVYMLSFVPAEKADGAYHKLKVTLKDSRKLSVRARAGYYATEAHAAPVPVETAAPPAPEKSVTTAEVAAPHPPASAPKAVDVPERIANNGPVSFRARTNLVQVPVVVRDKNGNPVGGLHKSDFQLSDRGQRQEITSFSEEKMERPEAPVSGGSTATTAVETTGVGARPPAVAVPDRFTAYIFDDVHMRIGDLSQVREAVWKNMQESAGPSVRMALFTTSRRISVDFTGDLEKLHAALFRISTTAMYRSVCYACGDISFFLGYQVMRGNRIALQTAEPLAIPRGASTGGNPGPPAGRGAPSAGGLAQPTSPVGNEGMAAEIAATRAVRLGQQETDLSLNALRDVARRMTSLAGRRTIVMLSQGFFVTDEQQGEMEQTVDWALRSGVVINTLSSSGLITGMEMGVTALEDDTVEPNDSTPVTSFTNSARLANAENLAFIAEATGGTAILNSNDYLGGVRRIATPPEYRYILGFSPHEIANDGKFHGLTVKLANSAYKGDTLQARRGYYAPKEGEGLPEAAAKEIETAVFARDDVRDLPVEMRTEVKDGGLTVSADIDLKLLHYRKADGRNCQELTAVAAVFDHDGNFLAGKQQTLTLKLRDATLEGLGQKPPEKLQSLFPLSPGSYLVRLVVRSAEDQALTEISSQVDIP